MTSTFTGTQAIHTLTHAWLGTANASQSVERKDGVEVRRNLVTNPSFSTALTGWGTGTANGTLTRDTTVFHSGAAGAKFTAKPGVQALGGSYSAMAPVEPGQTYTLSFWAMVPANLTATYTAIVTFYDPTNAYLPPAVYAPTQLSMATDWTRISLSLTVPANAANMSFTLLNSLSTKPTAADVIYVDDVLLESGAQAQPYFDGSTPTTNATGTVQPLLVTQYAATSQSRHLIHDVLGTPWPAITLQPAGPRTGTMSALFTTEQEAADFFTMLRGAAVLTFSDTDTFTTEMQFVATDAIQMAPDSQDSRRWVVSFGYMEVQP